MSSLYEQLSPASMTVRDALNLSEALRDIPLKSPAERAVRALAGAYFREQALRRTKSEPLSGKMIVRVRRNTPEELSFCVEYAGVVGTVSAWESDYPNPDTAGKTFLRWYSPPPSFDNLAEAAGVLRQIAEFIDDIETLGARRWLELYQIATRSLE